MAREFFKNLPDTTTPLEASRINGLLDGEEALGSIVVDDVSCKNMLDINEWIPAYIDNSGNVTSNTHNATFTKYIAVKPNTQYVFSANASSNSLCIVEYNSSKTFIKRNVVSSNTINSITTDSNTNFVRVWLNYNGADITQNVINTLNLQFELGNVRTTYVPYKKIIKEQDGCVKEDTTFYANDFKCKNLATFGYGSTTANQVTTTFDNSSFKINGTANASGYSFQKVVCTLPAGTYTLSTKLASGSKSGTSFQMTLVSATTDYVVIPSNTTDRTATFTLTEQTELKFRLYINNSNSMTFNNMVLNVQIEKGSVATTWTPYKEFENKKIYSTDEQIIGQWIDRKPLYRKTISCGALPNSTTKNTAHNISNISSVVHIYGFSKNSSGVNVPIPWVEINNNGAQINVSSTHISITTSSDRSAFSTTYVTLEYTKTTD